MSNRVVIVAALAAVALLQGCSTYAVTDASRHYRVRKLASETSGGGDSAISPDGKKFLTSIRRSGNWDIWMFDIERNAWKQVTHEASDEFEAQWSPDGREIVYTSTRNGNKDIFRMNLARDEIRQLTDDPEDDEYPVFSPNGTEVSFTGGRWKEGRQFFTVQADGRGRQPLSKVATQAGACTFHPSGESLVCHSYDTGTGNVYLYPRKGGRRLQITEGNFWDYKPAVSGNGQWLAFSRSLEGPSAIWVMPFPAGEATRLSQGEGDDRWPTWSQSGNELLFHRLVDEGRSVSLYDPATRESREIVPAGENPMSASLDPNGEYAVYAARVEGKDRLRIVETGSGKKRDLRLELEENCEAAFPRWSPKGSRIAFALKRGDRWDIAVTEARGGPVKVLSAGIPNARGMRSMLDWSPDGRKLVFHASTAPFEANLYLANVETGSVRNLTNDEWYSESPAFTPDGKGVTFMSTRGGNWTWGFFKITIATGKVELLLGPDYIEKNYPRLNAEGTLLWSQLEPDGREMLAMRRPGGEITLIRQSENWARWPSYSPDGKKILFTSVDHRVEYWLAENLHAADSPLQTRPNAGAVQTSDASAPKAGGPNRSAQRASPVQMHHR